MATIFDNPQGRQIKCFLYIHLGSHLSERITLLLLKKDIKLTIVRSEDFQEGDAVKSRDPDATDCPLFEPVLWAWESRNRNKFIINCCILSFKEICRSVARLRPTVCEPMDCSTPGFPALHCHPELAQTHVHWVSDGIQPSHPLQPLLFLPSIFPSFRVLSNESALHPRWPKYWSFSFSISPSNEFQGWFPLWLTGLISLLSKGFSKAFNTTIQKHWFFRTPPSFWSNSNICTWIREKPWVYLKRCFPPKRECCCLKESTLLQASWVDWKTESLKMSCWTKKKQAQGRLKQQWESCAQVRVKQEEGGRGQPLKEWPNPSSRHKLIRTIWVWAGGWADFH